MEVTRRAMIGTSAAALGLLTLEQLGASSASASELSANIKAKPSIVARATAITSTFSPDWTTQFNTEYPTYLEFADASGAKLGFSAEFVIDTRLFTARPEVILIQGSSIQVVPTSVTDLPNLMSSVIFELPSGLGSKSKNLAVEFATPFSPRNLYPSENIGAISPITLNLAVYDADTATQTIWSAQPQLGAVNPWGVELSAGWSQNAVTSGAQPLYYRVPTAIRVLSTGPGACPPSASLRVELDRRLVGAVSVADVALNGTAMLTSEFPITSSTVGDALQIELALDRELPVGSHLDVRLEVQPAAVTATLQTVRYAAVSLVVAADPSRPTRDTTKYSLTDLTSSGNGQYELIAEGIV